MLKIQMVSYYCSRIEVQRYICYDIYRVSHKKRPTFESVLLPEYIGNDILQYLIE